MAATSQAFSNLSPTARVSYLRTPNDVNHVYVWKRDKIISVPRKFNK